MMGKMNMKTETHCRNSVWQQIEIRVMAAASHKPAKEKEEC
jgi:hypothetical protein